MPLIVICGHPSSGKTYRATQIVEYFERRSRGEDVENDHGSQVTRSLGDLNISSGDARSGTSVSGLTEAALSRIDRPTAPSNTIHRQESQAGLPRPGPAREATQASTRKTPSRKVRIHHISDHTLSLPRSVYGTARAEKDARATLYSAVKRALGRDDVVVLDSGNYIKGWRYQLHCEAKNLGTPSCVVHVGTTGEEATALNDKNLAQQADTSAHISGPGSSDPYDTQIHAELVMRFEEPNPLARWDSPLFTVPWSDSTPPLQRLWEEMVEPKDKDGARRVIKPNQAAVLTPASAPGHLYVLDRVTQAVLAKVQAYGLEHAGEGGGVVVVDLAELAISGSGGGGGEGAGKTKKVEVHLPTNAMSVPALQRMRRQFIALHRQQMGGMGMVMGQLSDGRGGLSPERLGELFVDWLNDAFEQA